MTALPASNRKGVVLVLADSPVLTMIPTKDRARAQQFYENSLGLKVVNDLKEGVEFQSGGASLFLYETFVDITAQHTLATWRVNDLESEMKALRSKGVTFEEYDLGEIKTENGVAAGEHGRACWFKDPDGNLLSLLQEN